MEKGRKVEGTKTFSIRSKSWFLTYPKCTLTKEEVHGLLLCKQKMTGGVIAQELHEDGTPHIHIYLSLSKRYDCQNPHYWDLMEFHGNYQHARNVNDVVKYIKKDENYLEFGDLDFAAKVNAKAQHTAYLGKRLQEEPLLDILMDHPELTLRAHDLQKAQNTFKQLKLIPQHSSDTRGIWIYGKPGTGKTRDIHIEESDLYLKAQNKWWDGYTGQKAVLIDDFDKQGTCLSHYLKIWADRYPITGEVKGSTIPLTYDRLYVTSNYTIHELFGDDHHLEEALERRFKVIHKLTNKIFE